jgi:site-specific recombinase XerD
MTDKTLYEILGVAPDATKKEIKAAYLRESSKHHPDKKGGTAQKFNEIKQAFDALYNDETRAEYDATGKVKPPEDEEQFVRHVVIEMLKATLDHPDVHDAPDLLRVMGANIIDKKSSYLRASMLANKMINKRQKMLDKIKRKNGGENLITAVIEKDIAELAVSIANAEKGMTRCTAMLELLDEYEFEGLLKLASEVPPARRAPQNHDWLSGLAGVA